MLQHQFNPRIHRIQIMLLIGAILSGLLPWVKSQQISMLNDIEALWTPGYELTQFRVLALLLVVSFGISLLERAAQTPARFFHGALFLISLLGMANLSIPWMVNAVSIGIGFHAFLVLSCLHYAAAAVTFRPVEIHAA